MIKERFTLRRAREAADLDWCARLMAGSEPWITLRRGYQAGLALLGDRTKEVYVAAEGSRRLGFIALVMSGAFKGYIQIVAVTPERRGQGVGRRMISFAEKRILKETQNVFICVSSFNKEARRLYERLGYRLVGELKDYIIKGHSELLLRKTTGPLKTPKAARAAVADVVVVDLDGTLADIEHRRRFIKDGRRDWKAFHEACGRDKPNAWCVRLIQSMRAAGFRVELVSGRSQAVEKQTRAWLSRVFNGDLSGMNLVLLRPHGNATKDTDLKREWLRAFGKDRIIFAVDDRRRVVDMWRAEGVVCLQCDDWEERERAAEVASRVRAAEDRRRL